MGSEAHKPTDPQTGKGIQDRKEKFFETLRGLPSPAREFLATLSSQFMEADVYRAFREDPEKIQNLEKALKGLEVNEEGITQVMDFFNLPFTKK